MSIRHVSASTIMRYMKKGAEYSVIFDYKRTAVQIGERTCWFYDKDKLHEILLKASRVKAKRLPNKQSLTDNFIKNNSELQKSR